MELPEHRLEALFQKYDADGSGMIEYPEFKKALGRGKKIYR